MKVTITKLMTIRNKRTELIALRNKCKDHYYYCKYNQESEPDDFDEKDNEMYAEIVRHKIKAGYMTILGSEDWCCQEYRLHATPLERIEEVVTYLTEEIRHLESHNLANLIKELIQERLDDDEMDIDLCLDDFLKEYESSLSDTEIAMIECVEYLMS